MLDTAISACRHVWDGTYDPSDEQVIHRYFKEHLYLRGDAAQDISSIMKLMNNTTLPFAKIAHEFHMIDSNAVTVYIPTEESRPLIEQYRSGQIDRTLVRKLGRFGVTVYPYHLQSLLDAGDVEDLGGEVYVLLNEEMYNESTGLSLRVEFGKANMC